MVVTPAAVVGVGVTATAAAADPGSIAAAILTAAAVVGALAYLWRASGLGELRTGAREFFQDWRGDPGRPGREPIPSFPERMAGVERQTDQLPTLAEAVAELHQLADRNRQALDRLDGRVSDHRARNDQQAQLLRDYLDARLAQIDNAHLRAETYRAALSELGIVADPAPDRHPGDHP